MPLLYDHVFQCILTLAIILIPSIWILISFYPVKKSPAERWFHKLKKPDGAPSMPFNAVFWIISYILMGFASYIIFIHFDADPNGVTLALVLFAAQYLLTLGVAPVFFGNEDLIGNAAIITTLVPFVLWTMFEFHKVSHIACFLLIPYILWLGYDTAVAYQLLHLNTQPTSRH